MTIGKTHLRLVLDYYMHSLCSIDYKNRPMNSNNINLPVDFDITFSVLDDFSVLTFINKSFFPIKSTRYHTVCGYFSCFQLHAIQFEPLALYWKSVVK